MFSLESVRTVSPRLPWTLIGVVAVILALELVARVTPHESITPPRSRLGEILFIEKEVLPQFPAPQAVFLGTSRIRRALVPKQFDDTLGLPSHASINLGLSAGRLFEAIRLYERNAEQLGGARLVILNLDEWQLSSGLTFGSLYEVEAPWDERVRFEGAMGTRMVMDGIFTQRLKLKMIPPALAIRFGLKQQSGPALTLTDEHQVLPPPRKGIPEDIDPKAYHETIGGFYKEFELHPVLLGHVEKLAAMVRARNARLVLMQLPNRRGYQQEVERLRHDEYWAQRRALEDLARRLNVPLYAFRFPEECGLTDAHYEDYGHIRPEGARIFTRFLAERLRADGLIAAPASMK